MKARELTPKGSMRFDADMARLRRTEDVMRTERKRVVVRTVEGRGKAEW